MKLENSEVLLLSQILFNFKCNPSHNWDAEDQINSLYERMCNYLAPSSKDVNHEDDYDNSSCVWHSQESSSEIEDEEQSDDQEGSSNSVGVEGDQLLNLESLRVEYDGKRSLIFEKGISKKTVDLSLDDGDEILCDVTEIQRDAYTLDVNCVQGWVTFDVNKFPKSWTSLLQTKILYKVVFK